ncbi:MAG: tyrosine-type recombinase/integrase [Acidobacteriota bacterium]|nr:tyrosine-type recombinase/integrase [Acidobacteriota bacterium]
MCLIAEEDSEHLIFFSRNHTPLTTNNIRRRLRAVLECVELEGVTPHSFRRTVATFLDRASGPDLTAEMLGHPSSDHQTALHRARRPGRSSHGRHLGGPCPEGESRCCVSGRMEQLIQIEQIVSGGGS